MKNNGSARLRTGATDGQAKIVVILLALAVVLGVGVYVVLQRQARVSVAPVEGTETFSGIDTKTELKNGVDISDWKTYVNDQYGFQFKYPIGWNEKSVDLGSVEWIRVEGVPVNDILQLVGFSGDIGILGGFRFMLAKNVDCDDPKDWLESSIGNYFGFADDDYPNDTVSEGKFVVAGSTYKKIDYLLCGSGTNIMCMARQNICIPRSGASLVLTGETSSDATKAIDVENDEILKAILASFQLTK